MSITRLRHDSGASVMTVCDRKYGPREDGRQGRTGKSRKGHVGGDQVNQSFCRYGGRGKKTVNDEYAILYTHSMSIYGLGTEKTRLFVSLCPSIS